MGWLKDKRNPTIPDKFAAKKYAEGHNVFVWPHRSSTVPVAVKIQQIEAAGWRLEHTQVVRGKNGGCTNLTFRAVR